MYSWVVFINDVKKNCNFSNHPPPTTTAELRFIYRQHERRVAAKKRVNQEIKINKIKLSFVVFHRSMQK